jgi:uncharacterized membrane protein YgaE (UPF0421/DUF939 family)
MKLWKWEPENLPSVIHSIRTAIAATLSLAIARLFGLPEAYWAAIATLVVMQSTLGATLLLSIERIAATALGALVGALLASYFTGNLLVFTAAVFLLGLLCSAFRMEKTAYRYASVTLAIIVLIPRSHAAWIVALHRFFEVSVGILVALALVARVAGASTRIRKTKRRIICALCCHARSAHMNSHSKFVSVYLNNARVVCPA